MAWIEWSQTDRVQDWNGIPDVPPDSNMDLAWWKG